jgi:hypothetical protein
MIIDTRKFQYTSNTAEHAAKEYAPGFAVAYDREASAATF